MLEAKSFQTWDTDVRTKEQKGLEGLGRDSESRSTTRREQGNTV